MVGFAKHASFVRKHQLSMNDCEKRTTSKISFIPLTRDPKCSCCTVVVGCKRSPRCVNSSSHDGTSENEYDMN